MRTGVSIAVGIACLLAGCAIHPLPENVTRETTAYIVQKIRCEAREALINIAIDVLRDSDHLPTLALADRVASGELDITDLFENKMLRQNVDPKIHAIFDKFALTTIAMDFTFDITETNNNQANANFRDPFTRGTFMLGAAAGMKLDREGKRQLQVADTFLELHDLLSTTYCMEITTGRANYIYPITGNIGLQEVLHTFIDLSQRAGGVEKYTDTLTFTTTLTASATPKVVLNPIPDHRFRLADASLTSSALRTDAHSIAFTVKIGQRVTSLEQARKLAGISKDQVLRTLNDLRTENFFTTVRVLQRQSSQQAQ